MTNYQIVRLLVASRLRNMIPDKEWFEEYVGRALSDEEAQPMLDLFAKYTDDLAGKITPKIRRRD